MTSTLELNAKVDSRPNGVIPLFRNKKDHEFYEYILNDIPDLDLELFTQINDYGIENVDQWEDSYSGSFPTSCNVEAQFTEQLMDDLGYLELNNVPNPMADYIDWQLVWDRELSNDYFVIEDGERTHFFNRNF